MVKNSSVPHFGELLRHLVEDKGSVIWITTHYNIVKYWEDVLCSSHRKLRYSLSENGKTLEISNIGKEKLESIPIDLELSDKKKITYLVDIDPESSIQLNL